MLCKCEATRASPPSNVNSRRHADLRPGRSIAPGDVLVVRPSRPGPRRRLSRRDRSHCPRLRGGPMATPGRSSRTSAGRRTACCCRPSSRPSTRRPAAAAGLSEPTSSPAWKNLPSWAVVATADKAAGADDVLISQPDAVVFRRAEPAGRARPARCHLVRLGQVRPVVPAYPGLHVKREMNAGCPVADMSWHCWRSYSTRLIDLNTLVAWVKT
jgi:hypothetical protein